MNEYLGIYGKPLLKNQQRSFNLLVQMACYVADVTNTTPTVMVVEGSRGADEESDSYDDTSDLQISES